MKDTRIAEQVPITASGHLTVDVRVQPARQRVVLTVCGKGAGMDFTRATLRIGERALSLFDGEAPSTRGRYTVEVDAAFAQLHACTVGWAGTFEEEAPRMVEVLELASATVLGSGTYTTPAAQEWMEGQQVA